MTEETHDTDLLDLLFDEEPHLFGYAALLRVSAGSARAQAQTLKGDEKLRAEGRFQAYDDAWNRSVHALSYLLVEWGDFTDPDDAHAAVKALITRASNEIARREIAKRKQQKAKSEAEPKGEARVNKGESDEAQELRPFAAN